VSVEVDESSGPPSSSKTTENVEKFENSSMTTVTKQSTSSQTMVEWVMKFDRRS
jgi:hypothetical protein